MEEKLESSILYQQVGENYRYFLGWRYKAPAGYLASLAALAYAYSQCPHDNWKTAVLIATVPPTLFFWIVDLRNRTLFVLLERAGRRSE